MAVLDLGTAEVQDVQNTVRAAAQPGDTLHLWKELQTPEAAADWVEAHLQAARDAVAALLTENGQRTIENTLELYDKAVWHLRMAGSQAHVMFMVHPSTLR